METKNILVYLEKDSTNITTLGNIIETNPDKDIQDIKPLFKDNVEEPLTIHDLFLKQI